jgi:hypothetical protein
LTVNISGFKYTSDFELIRENKNIFHGKTE